MRGTSKKGKHLGNDDSWLVWTILIVILLIILATVSFYYIRKSLNVGVSATESGFTTSYAEKKDVTYELFYNSAYDYAEKENHVSNEVSISISGVKEKTELEVLDVSDVVYSIRSAKENGVDSWIRFTGTGEYVVNLTAAEYVIDNGRQRVLARIPSPELKTIEITDYEIVHYSEAIWSGSIPDGEKLGQEQQAEAEQMIQEDFRGNESYLNTAKDSTVVMLSSLIQGFNPDVPNLQVEVEFYS